ncbi:hypothetical protein JCM17844_22680 [Iodidimonas gelatinilytica]|uniref:DUF1013 domain-containing protein n=1 Tax=Iodidimonas gelatinilytica TaxID=1236966 RepID=A0A5A7MRP6_9PROT|nr:cell cycle transcriptional regulator TrcR [Iodidimonas gelatinilytica]GEQ98631.1 hypothetical protein JCM17844_22680 [Iodidimonas gelatinilytica]
MSQPLMPMATAVWLIDNTSLTFKQIARFCGLHDLEVQGIADGTVGQSIAGIDPTANGQLTWAEVRRCQDDPSASLVLSKGAKPEQTRTKGPRYTPVSKRQDKPDAIAWLLRHHPELSDTQISRLVGTTKPTIGAIRERSHWNIANIRAQDPVALGLCKQMELDEAVQKAAVRAQKNAPAQPESAPAEDAADSGADVENPADDSPASDL